MREIRTPLLALAATVAAIIFWSGCKTDATPPPAPLKVGQIQPSPGSARIAYLTARLLEEFHYSQHPLDAEMSQKFFDEYINMLDGRHEHFLQSDIDEFSIYRTNLDKLTVGSGKNSDLTPAYAIYARFSERFQQRIAYENELLAHEKFKFTADDKYVVDRRKEPFPKTLDEAKSLWRQQLRFEFLTEKLNREISETNGGFTIKLPPGATTNITETMARRYRWQLHTMTNWDSDMVLQYYLNALAHAYDPHSDYFSAPKAQDFSMQMNLSLFGIGAKLQDDYGYCTIKELIPGGPAAKSKVLKVEDRIVSVAQAGKPPVDVVDMELEKVVQMIRGPKSTEVKLVVSSAENRSVHHEVTLVRDEIKLEDAEAKARIIEQSDGRRLGYIDLPSFYAPVGDSRATPKYTSTDVAKLLQKLKQEKVSGLIMDLRGNPGGSLEEAVKFTGLFIKEGPIVVARNPDGHFLVDSDPDPSQVYDGPLVVMVNRFSASASEIAAAALQDYGRAIIVGDSSTHGKGTVQNLNPLNRFIEPGTAGLTNDPGELKITIRKFYRINGGSTQFKGVIPDIILPDTWNYSTLIGESSLDNPLPWDTINPVRHDDYNEVQPYISLLRTNSMSRVATNQDFKYVNEDIVENQKFQSERTMPLNEREAIKDRERIALRNKAREKERNSRQPLADKIYEITLTDADKDGLPAPLAQAATNAVTGSVVGKSSANNNLGANVTAEEAAAKSAPTKPKSGDDPMLEETEKILNDYITLQMHSGVTAAQ